MDSVKDLLSDPQKGLRQAEGVLCYVFREVLLWRNMTQFAWDKRLNAYFQKPHNKNNPDKGNLNKALKADTMSWDGFKKAIDFLSPVKATLEVRLIWGTSKPDSVYVINIDPTEDEVTCSANDFPYEECEIFKNQKPATTTMAHLYRHILWKEGINQEKWDKLWEEFLNNPVNLVGLDKKKLTSLANTQRRGLLSPNMSWNTLRRGFLLLRPKEERYTLSLQWTDDPNLRDKLEDSVHIVPVPDPHWVEPNSDE